MAMTTKDVLKDIMQRVRPDYFCDSETWDGEVSAYNEGRTRSAKVMEIEKDGQTFRVYVEEYNGPKMC